MLGPAIRIALVSLAAALLACAALVDAAWWTRHVVVPACYLPPPHWMLPATRIGLAVCGLALAVASLRVRRPSAGDVARVAFAVLLALPASELALRALDGPESKTPHPRLEWLLGDGDARTGWKFRPNQVLRF